MRFRLATGPQGSRQIADSFGQGMDTLFQAPLLAAQGAEEAQTADMKRRALQAQTDEAAAHAALFGTQADAARAQLDRGGLGELLKTAALQQGVPLAQLGEATGYLQTGQLAGKYNLPGDQQGPVLPAPQYADPALGARIMQSLGLSRQALTVGDKSVENIAKATGEYQKQGDVRAAQANPGNAGVIGQSYAAVDGKPLINNIGNTGRGFNQFTGDGGTLSPGVAALYDKNELAQVNQRNAAAGASAASADHSRAETQQVLTAPKGVLVQTDSGPVFADPRTGRSVPVLNSDGTPAAPKLKEIPATQNHAFIENAKVLQNIDQTMQAITQATGITLDADGNPVRAANVKPTAPDALGAYNYLGDGIRQRTDPKGVSVRAMVAKIGGQQFHDISGAAVSVGEAKRLQPFIPQATDSPAAVLQKLQNMRREYANVNDMLHQTYSREQGYRESAGARPVAGGVVDFHSLPAAGDAAPRQINFGDLK